MALGPVYTCGESSRLQTSVPKLSPQLQRQVRFYRSAKPEPGGWTRKVGGGWTEADTGKRDKETSPRSMLNAHVSAGSCVKQTAFAFRAVRQRFTGPSQSQSIVDRAGHIPWFPQCGLGFPHTQGKGSSVCAQLAGELWTVLAAQERLKSYLQCGAPGTKSALPCTVCSHWHPVKDNPSSA